MVAPGKCAGKLLRHATEGTLFEVTDVEGALDYWERFAELSEVLERDASGAQ